MAAKYTEIARTEVQNQYPVVMFFNGTWYQVQYGAQVERRLNYDEAAKEYGNCVMHAVACNGFTKD